MLKRILLVVLAFLAGMGLMDLQAQEVEHYGEDGGTRSGSVTIDGFMLTAKHVQIIAMDRQTLEEIIAEKNAKINCLAELIGNGIDLKTLDEAETCVQLIADRLLLLDAMHSAFLKQERKLELAAQKGDE